MLYLQGRLTSYSIPSLEKLVSHQIHPHAIIDICPFDNGILSLSQTMATIHSRGCVSKGVFSFPKRPSVAEEVKGTYEFTCMTLLSNTSTSSRPVAIAGKHSQLFSFDMNTNSSNILPKSSIEMKHGTSVMSCDQMLLCAGDHGAIDVLDCELRSVRVEHAIESHSGNVISLDTLGFYAISAGNIAHSVNPFDKNAPKQYYTDSIVRLYDLRMMQMVSSLVLPNTNTTSTNTTPLSVSFVNHSNIAVTLSDGQVFFFNDVLNEYDEIEDTVMECNEYFVVEHTTMDNDVVYSAGGGVTSVSFSSSSECALFGCLDGTLSLWKDTLTTSEHAPVVNNNSLVFEMPFPPSFPPKVSISPLDTSPASKYFITSNHHQPSLLSESSPAYLHALIQPQPNRTIKQSVLDRVVERGSMIVSVSLFRFIDSYSVV